MALGTALAIGQTALAGYKYLRKRGTAMKRFGETEIGRHLRTVSKRGIYSGKAKAEILGGVGRVAGGVEQQRRARLRGYLASRGMLSSIASARALEEPGIETSRRLTEAKSKIEIESELSKARALREYATLRTDWQERRRLEERADVSELATDIVGAGVTGIQTHLQEREIAAREKYYGARGRQFGIPENIIGMTDAELLEFAETSGYNYKYLKEIKENMMFDSIPIQ